MKQIKSVAIITTRQNYKWTSMQEVLPGIEKCWESASKYMHIESKIINVDVESFKTYSQFIFKCDVFIIIAFNETVSRFMRFVRTEFNTTANFILHLYGHASLALWPQARFGILDKMRSSDIFIGTCPADIRCINHTLENGKVFDIPYPHYPLEVHSENKEISFAYIGRISDQKNVNILIQAYAELKKRLKNLPKIFLYGKEDFFGSPNMGEKSTDCLKNLEILVANLGLTSDVEFRGFKEREEIYQKLGPNHIFLSASSHSDENFGMALLRSLEMGALAVVSDWGGHQVFAQYCSNFVRLVPIHFLNDRPIPDTLEFTQSMEISLSQMKSKVQNFDDSRANLSFCSEFEVTLQFVKVMNNLDTSSDKLELTEIAKNIHQQQKDFEAQGDIQKVFFSYSDPLAQCFLRSYNHEKD